MIGNRISSYFYNEHLSESNEEKCTAFQSMAWSLIVYKNTIKNCSTTLQAFFFLSFSLHHKQPPKMFCKKGVLRNFAKFTGKHLYQRLFFNKVAGKKESLAHVFFCEFCEISKNTFPWRTPHVIASKIIVLKKIWDSLTNFTSSF